jgi:mono/diheme cytochrome c family protein
MRQQVIWLMAAIIALLSVRHLMAQEKNEGKKLYLAYCSACHGESGKGDGPAAKALPAKPANHTDATFMKQLSDKYLYEIITKGGGSVGKSPVMPAWGNLKEKQVRDIIEYIRTLGSTSVKTGRSGAK